MRSTAVIGGREPGGERTSIPGDVFIDTNVIVYAYDQSDSGKRQTAQSILRRSTRSEDGVISTQVLAEFYSVVTMRLAPPLQPAEARDIVRSLPLRVVEIDRGLVLHAIDLATRYNIRYWDAQIVAAAKRAGATRLLSEDLNAGQEYESVVVENPFV